MHAQSAAPGITGTWPWRHSRWPAPLKGEGPVAEPLAGGGVLGTRSCQGSLGPLGQDCVNLPTVLG